MALTAGYALMQRGAAERVALGEVGLYAHVLEDQLTRALTTSSNLKRSLAQRGTLRRAREDDASAQRLLQQQLVGQPFLRSMAVLDARGEVLVSTVRGEAGLRIDLTVLGPADPDSPREVIGPLLPIRELGDLTRDGHTVDASALPMLRPIPMNGQPSPLWLVTLINPDYFATQHAVLTADTPVRVTIADLDGHVIATTGEPLPPGRQLATLPAYERFLPDIESGRYLGEGTDGLPAVVAFRLSRQWPMVVLAELPQAQVATAARARVLPALGVCGIVLVLLGALGWAGDRALLREARSLELETRLGQGLAEAEERWKLALEGAGHGVWDIDLVSDEVTLSPRMAELLGVGPSGGDWTGAALRALLHPDDAAGAIRALQRHLNRTSAQFTAEFRVRGADGQWHWLLASGTRVDTGEGAQRRKRVIGTVTDIGERRRIQQALRESNALLDEVSRMAMIGGWRVDLRTGKMRWTDETFRLHDLEPGPRVPTLAQAVGYHAPASRPLIHAALRSALDEGTPYDLEVRLVTARGRTIWVRSQGRAEYEDGEAVRLVGTLQDITARREAETALAEARQRELAVGGRIQQSLLMQRAGEPPAGLWLSALSQASQGIDGDFFEMVPLDAHTVDVIVGDVMGKGVAAALLGAATKMQFSRSLAQLVAQSAGTAGLPSPAGIVADVHQAMTPHLQALEAFVTLCYARVDLRRRTVCWVGCGHEEPLLLRADGSTVALSNQHPPLGILDTMDAEQSCAAMAPGDALFMASDGASDARLPGGGRVGRAQVQAIVQRLFCSASTPAAVLGGLRRALEQLGAEADDDLTLAMLVAVDPAAEGTRLELARGLDDIRPLRELVQARALAAGVDDTRAGLFALACVEAYTNAVRHGRGAPPGTPLEAVVRTRRDALVVEIVAVGDPFVPPSAPEEPALDGYPEGGFGLTIMEQASDTVAYEQREGINTTRLTLHLDDLG